MPIDLPDIPPRLQPLWYRTHYTIWMALLTLGFSLKIRGQRFVPQSGPALVIANHQSFLDPIVCALATRRQLVPLARKTLFRNRYFAWLIRSLNAVPIDQEGVGKDGIRAISERLRAGHAVLVFPEGNRTEDGVMHPFRPGIHLLLKKAPAPIIPLGLAGVYDAWPRSRAYPIPAPLCLPPGPGTLAAVFGPPLDSRRYAELPRDEALGELFEKVAAVQQQAEECRRK